MGQKRDITKGEQKTALLFIYIVLYLCTICSFNLQGERHAGRSLQSFYKLRCQDQYLRWLPLVIYFVLKSRRNICGGFAVSGTQMNMLRHPITGPLGAFVSASICAAAFSAVGSTFRLRSTVLSCCMESLANVKRFVGSSNTAMNCSGDFVSRFRRAGVRQRVFSTVNR